MILIADSGGSKTDWRLLLNDGTIKQASAPGFNPYYQAIEDLKRYFNNKMHDQRAYLVGLVRDLEKKQNSASNVHQEIANIWDKLN